MTAFREKWILENWSVLFENESSLSDKEREFFRQRYGQTELTGHQFNWLNDIAKRFKIKKWFPDASRLS